VVLIRCGGCEAIFDSGRAVCPACGRCPSCGRKRAKGKDSCPGCGLPYCGCCGRCPGCGGLRYEEVGPCECGHPSDPEVRAAVERACPVHWPKGKPWWRFW